MITVGITGGTGSGKTTLLRRVEAMGGCAVDCDAVYHRLLASDDALRRAIARRFPTVAEDGAWDRKKLGRAVFGDPGALADLNAITHPRVRREVERRLQEAEREGCTLAAVDAIGLFESGLDQLCAVTVAVTAPAALRIRRLMAREGIPEDYARLRIAAQPDGAQFSARCRVTLENSYPTESEFTEACDRLLLDIIGGIIT